MNIKKLFNILSVIGLICTFAYMFYLWKNGILTDQAKMDEYITSLGIMGMFVFVLIQIIQVVIPIIPGGVSCVVGIAMFGYVKGFIFNYIGICIGSIIVFLIAKHYGQDLMSKLFSEKKIEKYKKWTETNNRFAKLFALAIFSPVAPDDFLCYLAGTTNMKLKTFVPIILLGKPLPIIIYSMGLNVILQFILMRIA